GHEKNGLWGSLRLANREERIVRAGCGGGASRAFWGGMSDVSQILNALAQGDPHAADQLLPLVYDELRRLAAQRLAHEAAGQTLEPTALVHEAYLRLVGDGEGPAWEG